MTKLKRVEVENEQLRKDRKFLMQEYHYLCQKLTVISNVFGPLWHELRERNGDHQTIEQSLEEGDYEIYD